MAGFVPAIHVFGEDSNTLPGTRPCSGRQKPDPSVGHDAKT